MRGMKAMVGIFLVSVQISGASSGRAPQEAPGLELTLEWFRAGDYQAAEEALEGHLPDAPLAVRLRIELAERRGRYEQAETLAAALLKGYEAGRYSTAADLAQAAFAGWRLQDWQTANRLFIRASQLPQPPLSLYVDWGQLYLEKFNPAEAEAIFRDGLRIESTPGPWERWGKADLYAGLAQALRDQSKPGFSAFLDLAEKLDPENLQVLSLRASSALQAEDFEQAQTRIRQGLERVPDYLPLLELQAALDYSREDAAAFEHSRQAVLALNPRDGELFEQLGDLAVSRRRLEEAVDLYSQALTLRPNLWTALASRGINLLRLGREAEGKEALEEAYLQDPFNIATVNTLRLLDSFKRFEAFETPHFQVKLRRDEVIPLKPYVSEILERCLRQLEAKYRCQVEGKTVFEMFPDHEDFAVRTLGMPGLGALGATFGHVVAMDSPAARPPGTFHWASTLWHELAHVITLSLSRNRVPRWFTEGLSMLEEQRAGPGWGDGLTPGFVRAFEAGKLLPIATLNTGFVRPEFPEQVVISYYQAGWICELLEREFGTAKIREMLVAYGEGKATDAVFEQVLGCSTEAIDTRFLDEVRTRLAPYVSALQPLEVRPENLESALRALEERPDSYALNLTAARFALETEEFEVAESRLRRAIEAFPFLAGPDSPYASLVDLLLKQNRAPEALELLDEWWRRFPMLIDRLFLLVDLKVAQGDRVGALNRLQEGVYLAPLSPELHRRLGDLYLEEGASQEAVREFSVLLALDPVDPSGAHYKLASAHFRLGDLAAARLQVLQALEIAPGYEDAQKLLLEIVRK